MRVRVCGVKNCTMVWFILVLPVYFRPIRRPTPCIRPSHSALSLWTVAQARIKGSQTKSIWRRLALYRPGARRVTPNEWGIKDRPGTAISSHHILPAELGRTAEWRDGSAWAWPRSPCRPRPYPQGVGPRADTYCPGRGMTGNVN